MQHSFPLNEINRESLLLFLLKTMFINFLCLVLVTVSSAYIPNWQNIYFGFSKSLFRVKMSSPLPAVRVHDVATAAGMCTKGQVRVHEEGIIAICNTHVSSRNKHTGYSSLTNYLTFTL